MSRRPADAGGPARVAVVGAPTVDGTHVRQALAERGVPGARVDLYGQGLGEVLVGEYAGEARMIQEPDLEEVASHELIFLCEPGDVADRIDAAAPGSIIIDLRRCLPPEAEPSGVPLEIADDLERGTGRFAVPHSLSLLLADVLLPLERSFGVAEAAAVVIRPAADFGKQGVEELREQTVRLLNFSRVPVETFGRQLAFNIIPDRLLADGSPDLELRIAAEVTELLGWGERRFTTKLLAAPVFHGHGLQLRFRLCVVAPLDDVRAVLDERQLLRSGPEGEAATPLDVTEESWTRVSGLSNDGLGGFWLWVVAGEAGARGAQQAVRLAAAVCGL
jgi:aspartate-semialdehyde dehydrogenase